MTAIATLKMETGGLRVWNANKCALEHILRKGKRPAMEEIDLLRVRHVKEAANKKQGDGVTAIATLKMETGGLRVWNAQLHKVKIYMFCYDKPKWEIKSFRLLSWDSLIFFYIYSL